MICGGAFRPAAFLGIIGAWISGNMSPVVRGPLLLAADGVVPVKRNVSVTVT